MITTAASPLVVPRTERYQPALDGLRAVAVVGAPDAVCAISSEWLQVLGGGVVVPPTVDVYVSDVPGKLGTHLGTAHAPPIDLSPQTSTITVRGREPLRGQYATVRVTSFGSWTMVDEIGVTALPSG